ncbi:unannotated protein [freshwater metagenome]|uniref:Unannotated protein n=1 Tax=freshwater metagenome TaxID=449393 RepID=A0A6J7XRL4_9ZZZZ|nr:signal recognition particle-docking protein FtsY [Actinomycetota bacterium]
MGLFSKLISKLTNSNEVSLSDWKTLEADLLAADIGPKIVESIINQARLIRGDQAQSALTQVLMKSLSRAPREMNLSVAKPSTFLIVGVNGTGKTTSAAKLAAHFQKKSLTVILGAADTFRAAAVEQLQTWGKRLDILVISGKEASDPAAVAFESAQKARDSHSDILIIDTAGRLHNKSDLMHELEKVKRVVEKITPVNEVLLVIDATTGQNGLIQAQVFSESVAVTGIILTKLDGSAKGGIALSIEATLDIPIKWIATGESIEDIAPFDPERYIEGLLA